LRAYSKLKEENITVSIYGFIWLKLGVVLMIVLKESSNAN